MSTQNWFCTLGNSQAITDSLLAFFADVLWRGRQPRLSDGILAATWALDHIVAVSPGGAGGDVQIAVLEHCKKGGNLGWYARMLADNELGEHRQWIEGAKDALRQQMIPDEDGAPSPPAPPPPPP